MKQIIFYLILFFGITVHAANMVEQFQLPAAQSKFTATTTSANALSVNQSRGYLMIQNSCASTDFISVNLMLKDTTGTGIQIQPCSSYEFDKVPTNSVWLKSNSGSQTALIIEGNVSYGESQ
jgi:hypothetical protein